MNFIDMTTCPVCRNLMDAVSSIEDAPPSPGDMSICDKCLTLLVFKDNMQLRLATEEDKDTLDEEDLGQIEHMTEMLAEGYRNSNEASN